MEDVLAMTYPAYMKTGFLLRKRAEPDELRCARNDVPRNNPTTRNGM